MSLRVFGAPQRYIQGPGALAALGDTVAICGQRCLAIADAVVLGLLQDRLEEALGTLSASRFAEFRGECTAAEIERLARRAAEFGADVVLGVGGGKAIDTAKGVSLALNVPVVIMPTVASNDSPTSRLAVVYTDEHVLAEVRRMKANPAAVLVDTEVILQAPERYFVAGIGDALSKKFEIEQSFATGADNFYGARPPYLVRTIAASCYAALREHAEPALQALRTKRLNDSFEQTVEATILLSGLAFENGGLSIAHSLTRGLSSVPEVARALHGEHVAFGLLVQLVLEGRPAAFVDELRAFYLRIGLPTTLAGLGSTQDRLPVAATIAQQTWERAPYVRHLVRPVDAARIEKAVIEVDQWTAGRS
jgi:glycerol dehydrogenase